MKKIVTLTILATLLAGCGSSDIYSGDVYTADQAKQIQQVSYGTLISVRPVKIQTNSSNGQSNSFIGLLGGAILGGFLGNTIGGGAFNALTAAGGAVGGALLGSAIENDNGQIDAVELEIRRDGGSSIVIVQKGSTNQFYAGQQVRLVTNGEQINVSPRVDSTK